MRAIAITRVPLGHLLLLRRWGYGHYSAGVKRIVACERIAMLSVHVATEEVLFCDNLDSPVYMPNLPNPRAFGALQKDRRVIFRLFWVIFDACRVGPAPLHPLPGGGEMNV